MENYDDKGDWLEEGGSFGKKTGDAGFCFLMLTIFAAGLILYLILF